MTAKGNTDEDTIDLLSKLDQVQGPEWMVNGGLTYESLANEFLRWNEFPIPKTSRKLLDEIASELKKSKDDRAKADALFQIARREKKRERTRKHKYPASMAGAIINSILYPIKVISWITGVGIPPPFNLVWWGLNAITTALGYRASALFTAELITGPKGPFKEED